MTVPFAPPPLPLPWLLGMLALGSLAGVLLAGQAARRRSAERRLHALAPALGHALEAVVVTDARRRITWVNPAFERITGIPAAEALGASPGRLLQFEGTDRETVARMRDALDAGRPFVGEVQNLGRRPAPYWVHLQIFALRDRRGAVEGFVAIQSDISERKRTEAALRDSAALLDETERIAGVGGWRYDPLHRRLRCTGQVPRLLGVDPRAGFGLRDGLRRFDAAGRRTLRELVAQSRRAGAARRADLPVTTPAGDRRWMQLTLQAPADVRQELTGSLLDITGRMQMKAELARVAALMRGAVEAVAEAFALFDPDDRLVFCNDRYREIHALSREVIVQGARFEDIIRHGAERGQYTAAIGRVDEWVAQQLAVRRQADRSVVQQLGDGRILRVLDRRMPDGHTVGFRVDITELVKATEAAEAADRSKSEFIATISHELRTPLQVITGFSALGQHFAHDNPPFGPMFDDIHAAGQRMLRLVNGLLDISKIDGTVGSMILRRQPVAPLVAAVMHELAPLVRERDVRFEARMPETLHADVDAFRFQQVLRNLLANALRFAPAGSAIAVAGIDRGLEGVEITVRDTGPGIPQDELETVFEPFVQSSRTRDGAGGTGLGLAICRRIAGAHGGRIVAECPDGGGALLRLWLPPASPATPPAAVPEPAPAAEAPAPQRTRLSALSATMRARDAAARHEPSAEENLPCREPS